MHKKYVKIVLVLASTLLGVSGYLTNIQFEATSPFVFYSEDVNMASMTNYNNINSKLAIMPHMTFFLRYMSLPYKQRTMGFIY